MSDENQSDGLQIAKETDENNNKTNDFRVRLPRTMSFRDVFLVIVAVATVLSTWGAFKTKVSVLTERVETTQTQIDKLSTVVEKNYNQKSEQISELEQRVRELEGKVYKLEVEKKQIKERLDETVKH